MPTSKNQTSFSIEDNAAETSSLSYEQAFKALEQIVADMESGQLSLADSMAAYQRGNQLLAHCQKSLSTVEQQVKILNERQQLTAFNSGDE